MSPPLPTLRAELIIREQRSGDRPCAVVKDPVTGEFFRFGEVELFILRRLDGRTPLTDLQRQAELHFDAALPQATIVAFIDELRKNHLLAGAERALEGRTSRRRPRGNLFYFRVPLFDPTRLFDRLIDRCGFFFSRGFLIVSAAVIVTAAATLQASWSTFAEELPRLYQLSSIPLFMAIVLLHVMAHELAHGATCRHFGGDVREIGFMLIYFQPAFYCNVSDAWLFPERSKRLWVGFAGPYFELLLWAIAVFVWRLTAFDTWLNHIALIAMTGSGIKTFFNFNPLIKLDGYYLLSDWLEIPNLRRKSFRYVGDWVRKVSGWSHVLADATSLRERRVYLAYGLLATTYSFGLMGAVAFKTGDYLVESGEPVALAVAAGFMSARVRRRFRRLLGKSGDEDDDDVPSKKSDRHRSVDPARSGDPAMHPAYPYNLLRWPGNENDEAPAQAPVRRRVAKSSPPRSGLKHWPNWKGRTQWLGLAAAVLLGLFLVRIDLRVAGQVTVLPQENADVRARVEGIVEEVYVDEGDRVAAGDRIARLSGDALQTDLRVTQAEIREARAALRGLQVGATQAEIAIAREAVAAATDKAHFAGTNLSRMKALFQVKALTHAEFDDAQSVAAAAEHELTDARRKLELLLGGPRPELIAAEQARVERLEATRLHLEDQLSRLDITSPVVGVVATPSRQLHAMVRQLVPRGGLIAKVYDFETMTAQVMIPEKEIAAVRVDQRVELRVRAQPNVTFHGKVTAIAIAADGTAPMAGATSTPTSTDRSQTFIVTTQLDNSSLLLKPGMTGQAKIFCGPRRIVEVITRRLARTLKVEVWSWW